MSAYLQEIEKTAALCGDQGDAWNGINPEYAVRMKLQNRFKSGLEIAQYTADIMRQDMADYDALYQNLIRRVPLSDVSASFVMEHIKDTHRLPV